jgi:diguanylate cyclase (GGDEF)-like protein
MDAAPLLMDRVAATTGHRDRDEIELSLVQLLLQFLQADSVTLFKLARESDASRATHCIGVALQRDGSVGITRGGDRVQSLSGRAAWKACIEKQETQVNPAAGDGIEILFAVHGESGNVAGLIEVLTKRAPEARDLQLVLGVLRIVRNHMALIEYGERDTLTGLLNRKTFESQFDKLRLELQSAGQAPDGGAYWIGLADVDHFKSINDSYGHVFGDEVLLLVSRIIQRNFRACDKIYRFGGEEFVVLLRETAEPVTAAVLNRLRLAVERHRFPQVGYVTMSIGWTKILAHDTAVSAIGRADMALYHAKDCGRNRVFQYEQLLAEGKLGHHAQQLDAAIELF